MSGGHRTHRTPHTERGDVAGAAEAGTGVVPKIGAARSPTSDRGALLEALMSASPIHMYVIDPKGRYLYASAAGARALGRHPDELTGRHWRELGMPAELMEPFDRHRERVLAGGEPVTAELMYPTVDGPRQYVYTISPLADADGHVVATAVSTADITTSRRNEDALAESEARFRTALENAPIGMALVDLDGGFRYVNRALCELTGYPQEELVELRFQDITHPDDLDADLTLARRLEAGEIPSYQLEKRYIHRDGREIWVLLTGSIVRDTRGEPLYFIAQIQDVTARRSADAVQRRLTAILEATPDVVWTADPRGNVLYLNRSGRQLLTGGAAPEGRRVTGFHTESSARRLLLEGIPTAIRKEVWSGETDLVNEAGREIPASQVVIAHRTEGGELEFLSSIVRDMSGPKRAEQRQRWLAHAGQALSESLEVEGVLDVITRIVVPELADYCMVELIEPEPRWKATHADPEKQPLVERLSEWPSKGPGTVGGAEVLRSCRPELVRVVSEAWLQAVSHDEEHYRVLHELEPTTMIITPLQSRGAVVGLVTCGRSGPARPCDDEDVRLLRDLVARASLAMDNARLYAEVRDAVRIRDEVLRIVVHDLRSPLNTVSLASGALRESLPDDHDPQLDKWLDAITRSLGRANRLIEDLLDLARAQNHTLSVDRAELDPCEVVEEAVHGRVEQAAAAEIELIQRGPPQLPKVWADRHRILQVLDNLVGNALRFTPAGGTVTVGADEDEGGIRFWVSDTGPGIAPELHEHIFEPFWQAEATTGAGLGLAIAQGIVEAHEGELTVRSEPGSGATFEFTLACA